MIVLVDNIGNPISNLIALTMGALNGKIIVTEDQIDIFSETSGMAKSKVREHCQEFLKLHRKGRMNNEQDRVHKVSQDGSEEYKED